METSTEINKIAEALAKAQGAVKGAVKDSTNPHFKSSYADLASVWEACREAITANGLSVIQTPHTDEAGNCHVVTMLMHSSGQWVRDTFTLPPMKQDPQGYGSAITYMRRYALAAMVGVAPEDDDGNAASEGSGNGRPAPRQTQRAAPKQQAETDPEHVRMAKGLLAKLQGCSTAADTDALWDESQPILADIQKASDATFKHISAQFDKAKKALAEKEAA